MQATWEDLDAQEHHDKFGAADNHAEELAERREEHDAFECSCTRGTPCLWAVEHTPAPVAPRPDYRTNRYGGKCRKCGSWVEAEEGKLVGSAGNWGVEHVDACPEPEPLPELTVVPEGHYALPSTGDNDLVFYRVDHGKGKWAGRIFVKMIVGGSPDTNVRASHVAGILDRIAADPDAGARYGQEIGRCYACNRTLTDETSRALGIGPECRRKGR